MAAFYHGCAQNSRTPSRPFDDSGRQRAGKQCTRLALTWADRVSFVLTETLVVKRVAPLDLIKQSDESQSPNEEDLFDADMTLMTGELQKLLADLVEALGGFQEQAG